jgi:hypothetical protein
MNTATTRLIKFAAAERTANRATRTAETYDFRDGLFFRPAADDMEIRN